MIVVVEDPQGRGEERLFLYLSSVPIFRDQRDKTSSASRLISSRDQSVTAE